MASISVILLLILFLTVFFASAETVFLASNKVKIKIKAQKNDFAAKSAHFFVSNPDKFFFTSLAGSNFAAAFLIVLLIIILKPAVHPLTVFALVSVVVLLLWGLLPLVFFSRTADRLVYGFALLLHAFYFILYPITKLASLIYSRSAFLNDELLSNLFGNEIERLEGDIEEPGHGKKETNITDRVFSLSEQRVYVCMRPRTEIVGVDVTNSIDEVLSLFIESRFSKFPVYEENLDNIKGIVYAYDFFRFPADLKSIIREVMFVPVTKKSTELLNEFLKKKTNFAVVIDEFGGTAGIITLEDIIEELFGEIRDEYDIEEDICRKIDENSYLLSGKIEIDFFNEKFGLSIPTGDYSTISGFITSSLGRIPAQGENIEIEGFNVIIARANQNRIDVVRLNVKAPIPS